MTPITEQKPITVELLERAEKLLRTGQSAYGAVSWQAFMQCADLKGTDGHAEVNEALQNRNFLHAADIIQTRIAPLYS